MKNISYNKKPSLRGFFIIFIFILVSILPLSLFRIGYQFPLVSRELIILLIVNLLFFYFIVSSEKNIELNYLSVFFAAVIVYISTLNLDKHHALSVLLLFFILFILIHVLISEAELFLMISWMALIGVIFSFYQYWATAYDVVPYWLKLVQPPKRLAGVLGQSNLMACFVLIGLFSWLQTLWLRFGRECYGPLYFVPAVVFCWSLLLTGSKAGMLAFLTSILLFGFGLSRNGDRRLLKFYSLNFIWVSLVAVGLYLLEQPPGIETVIGRSVDFADDGVSTGARLIYWASAVLMGLDNFWSGTGLGGFKSNLYDYMVPSAELLRIPFDSISMTLWAHNDFLHVFAENGFIIFSAFLFIQLLLLQKSWPGENKNFQFIFLCFWSYFVCAQFEYPLNSHVISFMLVSITAIFLKNYTKIPSFYIKKSFLIVFILVGLIFINYNIVAYAIDMNKLSKYMKEVFSEEKIEENEIIKIREKYNYYNIVNSYSSGWRFNYSHYLYLTNNLIRKSDYGLINLLISDGEEILKENYSAEVSYNLSRLYFISGNYHLSEKYAKSAFLLKPSQYHFHNFGHLALVMIISQRERIPVFNLISSDHLNDLLDNNIMWRSMFDDDWIAI